jgi:hypothetical protein
MLRPIAEPFSAGNQLPLAAYHKSLGQEVILMKTSKLIGKTQVRLLEDAIDDWKPDHDCAMMVRDIEDFIRVGIFAAEMLELWFLDLWRNAAKGLIGNPHAEGDTLLRTIDSARNLMIRSRSWIEWAESKGYSVDKRDQLDTTVQKLEALKNDLLARWPMVDEEQIGRAQEEFRKGEFQSVEDILRELQGANPAEHQAGNC